MSRDSVTCDDLGFEDLTWMFEPGRTDPELTLPEAAGLWKVVRRTSGPALELNRRKGDASAIVLAAARGSRCISLGARRWLPDDTVAFLRQRDLRPRLEVHNGLLLDRPDLRRMDTMTAEGHTLMSSEASAFRVLVLHMPATYGEAAAQLAWHWELLQGTLREPGAIVLLGSVSEADSPEDQMARRLARELIDGQAADQFQRVGGLTALWKIGPPPLRLVQAGAAHLRDAKFYAQSEALYRGVLRKHESNAEVWHEFGRCLSAAEKFAEAEDALRRSLKLSRNHHCYNNLGLTLLRAGRPGDAIPWLQECLRMQPDYLHALNNLGWAFDEEGRLEEAIALFRRAIEHNPEYRVAQYNLARALIANGQLEEGWQQYDWRWKMENFPSRPRKYDWPPWDGSEVRGKTMILWAEQGLGDQIQFASMIPDLVRAGASGAIECTVKLVPLFRRSFPEFDVYVQGRDPDPAILSRGFDFQSPFASLAKYLRRDLSQFPNRSGFLKPDPEKVAYWKQRLDALDGNLKVGIAWSSRNLLRTRSRHYLTLDDLEPVLKTPGCTFICVQYGDRWEEIDEARERLGVEIVRFEDLDLFDDIDSVVAMTKSLDVGVATVYSSCLDVMAVNDIPVLAFNRGLLERNAGTDRVPWFPSVRAFRCPIGVDPAGTVQRIAGALVEFRDARVPQSA